MTRKPFVFSLLGASGSAEPETFMKPKEIDDLAGTPSRPAGTPAGRRLARWPAIPGVNIYSHTLLKEFAISGGHTRVPDGPGLGVEVDWDAVEGFRVDPDYRKPQPREIHTIFWPDGRQTQYKDGGYRADFLAGKLPVFLPGIRLERRLDDGSDEFDLTWTERFG